MNTRPLFPGCVINCRPIGVLVMEDNKGQDEKVIAVPSPHLTLRYEAVTEYNQLPKITLDQIAHFFEHYKDLEPGKWVKIGDWGDSAMAKRLINEAVYARRRRQVRQPRPQTEAAMPTFDGAAAALDPRSPRSKRSRQAARSPREASGGGCHDDISRLHERLGAAGLERAVVRPDVSEPRQPPPRETAARSPANLHHLHPALRPGIEAARISAIRRPPRSAAKSARWPGPSPERREPVPEARRRCPRPRRCPRSGPPPLFGVRRT